MQINRDLSDSQWAVLDPLIPEPSRRKDGRGRPWRARRPVLDGILWVLRTGAPWADLPDRYPPYQRRGRKRSVLADEREDGTIKEVRCFPPHRVPGIRHRDELDAFDALGNAVH